MIRAFAPGKLILCGEHAVVYGQPAIALPVASVGATASVDVIARAGARSAQIVLDLPDLDERWAIEERPEHPLARLALRTFEALGVKADRSISVVLESTIPIAGGMGSGAALSAALVRALARYFDRELGPATVSALVYEAERYYHGTPSGIDNTVVSFGQAVWYQRLPGATEPLIEPLALGSPLTLVIGDTGLRSPTRVMVGRVREAATAQPRLFESYFQSIGQLAVAARTALRAGDNAALGPLLDQNHGLLQTIGVSSPDLDRLVGAARGAGAMGAKLSGGGGGGVMLAVAADPEIAAVEEALSSAGAARVILARLPASGKEAILV